MLKMALIPSTAFRSSMRRRSHGAPRTRTAVTACGADDEEEDEGASGTASQEACLALIHLNISKSKERVNEQG